MCASNRCRLHGIGATPAWLEGGGLRGVGGSLSASSRRAVGHGGKRRQTTPYGREEGRGLVRYLYFRDP